MSACTRICQRAQEHALHPGDAGRHPKLEAEKTKKEEQTSKSHLGQGLTIGPQSLGGSGKIPPRVRCIARVMQRLLQNRHHDLSCPLTNMSATAAISRVSLCPLVSLQNLQEECKGYIEYNRRNIGGMRARNKTRNKTRNKKQESEAKDTEKQTTTTKKRTESKHSPIKGKATNQDTKGESAHTNTGKHKAKCYLGLCKVDTSRVGGNLGVGTPCPGIRGKSKVGKPKKMSKKPHLRAPECPCAKRAKERETMKLEKQGCQDLPFAYPTWRVQTLPAYPRSNPMSADPLGTSVGNFSTFALPPCIIVTFHGEVFVGCLVAC